MSECSTEKLDLLFRGIRGRYPWLPVLAIHWLYVTNGRSAMPAGAIDRVRWSKIGLTVLARIPWLALRAFYLVSHVFWLRLVLRSHLRQLQGQSFEGLAKTFVFPGVSLPAERDFYLGDLANQLRKRNVRLLTLHNQGARQRESDVRLDRLPELCLLQPLLIFQMVGRQYQAAFGLFWKAIWEKDAALRRWLLLVSRDCLRYLTLRNGLFYWIGKRALQWWPVHFFIFLYEGNAWEKCLTMGIREAAPHCKLVGYQHTVILQHSLELLRPSNSLAALRPPDVILNTGTKPATLMAPGHQPFASQLIPFGSVQYSMADPNNVWPRPTQKILLVLPEGIPSEMILLFNTALDLAALLPDYSIVLRCHPVISFKQIQSYLKQSLTTYPNLVLSRSATIEEDFARAAMVLYRGTSAILYAILRGLKPFYLIEKPFEENIDPLFELATWREKVDSVAQLVRQIKTYWTCPKVVIKADWQTASAYVHEYVKPVEAKSFDRLLEALA